MMDLTPVDNIIESHEGRGERLIMILQDIQDEFNYIPEPALEHLATRLDMSLSRIYHVATFYSSLSLTERGRHVIRVCDGTACHLCGAFNIREEIERQLHIKDKETTQDGRFSLEVVACLGACAIAPVMAVGTDYHGEMTSDKIARTLKNYK